MRYTIKAKGKKLSRLETAMLETAEDMHRIGICDDEEYSKITMRHLGVKVNADTEHAGPNDCSLREIGKGPEGSH